MHCVHPQPQPRLPGQKESPRAVGFFLMSIRLTVTSDIWVSPTDAPRATQKYGCAQAKGGPGHRRDSNAQSKDRGRQVKGQKQGEQQQQGSLRWCHCHAFSCIPSWLQMTLCYQALCNQAVPGSLWHRRVCSYTTMLTF